MTDERRNSESIPLDDHAAGGDQKKTPRTPLLEGKRVLSDAPATSKDLPLWSLQRQQEREQTKLSKLALEHQRYMKDQTHEGFNPAEAKRQADALNTLTVQNKAREREVNEEAQRVYTELQSRVRLLALRAASAERALQRPPLATGSNLLVVCAAAVLSYIAATRMNDVVDYCKGAGDFGIVLGIVLILVALLVAFKLFQLGKDVLNRCFADDVNPQSVLRGTRNEFKGFGTDDLRMDDEYGSTITARVQ